MADINLNHSFFNSLFKSSKILLYEPSLSVFIIAPRPKTNNSMSVIINKTLILSYFADIKAQQPPTPAIKSKV